MRSGATLKVSGNGLKTVMPANVIGTYKPPKQNYAADFQPLSSSEMSVKFANAGSLSKSTSSTTDSATTLPRQLLADYTKLSWRQCQGRENVQDDSVGEKEKRHGG